MIPTSDWEIHWKDGNWSIGVPSEGTDKLIKTYEERECHIQPSPIIRREGRFEECLYRFWLKSRMIHTFRLWNLAPVQYVINGLREDGFVIRPQDTLRLSQPINNMRDVYIESTVLEKLYGSGP